MDLYEQEKRVSTYYATIGAVIRSAWRITEVSELLRTFARQIGRSFGWHTVAIILRHGDLLHLDTLYRQGELCLVDQTIDMMKLSASTDPILLAARQQQAGQHQRQPVSFPVLQPADKQLHLLALPLLNRQSVVGILVLGRSEAPFDDCETEIFHDLAEHVALAIDNVRLYEENRQLVLEEERGRLSRDLHDSVNQKLFSLSLIAQGLRLRLQPQDGELAEGLGELGDLAQQALTEMKELIWALRSEGDAVIDMAVQLRSYAEQLGLGGVHVAGSLPGLAPELGEALWRVGQEALNNVRKHAGTDKVEVELFEVAGQAVLRITDKGCGFDPSKPPQGSLGLTSMKERVERLQGTLEIHSAEGQGTKIIAKVPSAQGGGET
ncbi:GAF domain-containing sensor histidine kinase [Paenibacillus sp. 1P07SE]|uniref:GAF domain-containing sensor histidine kinase n=1 Tax=Paenibacillus sp. 1P07SE TaxID=3132209 RepID=UPI0039A4E140